MYQIRYSVNVDRVGNGTGPGAVPQPVQTLQIGSMLPAQGAYNPIPVPGGDAPTQANFNTAVATMGTQIDAQIALVLAQIQGFASGGN